MAFIVASEIYERLDKVLDRFEDVAQPGKRYRAHLSEGVMTAPLPRPSSSV
jgi:hypothetical protein